MRRTLFRSSWSHFRRLLHAVDWILHSSVSSKGCTCFFFASPHRWKILMDELSSQDLPAAKRMSDTHGRRHKTCCQGRLVEIADDEEEKLETREEARKLAGKRTNFKPEFWQFCDITFCIVFKLCNPLTKI